MNCRVKQVIIAILAIANLSVSAFPSQSVYQSIKNGVTVTAIDYVYKPDEAVLTMPQALWGFLPCRSIKSHQLTSLGIRPVGITVSADKDVIIRAENIQYPQRTIQDVRERVSKALVGSVWRKTANYFGVLFGVGLVQALIARPINTMNLYRNLILGIEGAAPPARRALDTSKIRKDFLGMQAARLIVASIATYVVHTEVHNAIHNVVTNATITARAVSGGSGQQNFYLYLDNSVADKKITMTVQDLRTNETVADFEFVLN